MKMLLLGTTAFILYHINQPLKYYSEGIDDKIVAKAFSQWELKGIKYSKVSSPDKANIWVKKSSTLSSPNRFGEANYYEIRINTKYQFSNKELTNLISHEFGHYLSLAHNTKPHSIMNDKISLAKKIVTQEDKSGLYFLQLRIMIAKFVGTFYQYSR